MSTQIRLFEHVTKKPVHSMTNEVAKISAINAEMRDIKKCKLKTNQKIIFLVIHRIIHPYS